MEALYLYWIVSRYLECALQSEKSEKHLDNAVARVAAFVNKVAREPQSASVPQWLYDYIATADSPHPSPTPVWFQDYLCVAKGVCVAGYFARIGIETVVPTLPRLVDVVDKFGLTAFGPV